MSANLSGKTVLVVDDEADLLEIICTEFESAGAKVLSTTSGNLALKILETKTVDAIVSDMRMPNGSGMDLLRGIGKKNQPLPVFVFITGFSNIENEDIYKAGAQAIFTKPCDFVEVVEAVEEFLKK